MSSNNELNEMIAWENGELSEVGEILLFSSLIKSGLAWKLQGCYGRNAANMIESKVIDNKGNVLINLNEIYNG